MGFVRTNLHVASLTLSAVVGFFPLSPLVSQALDTTAINASFARFNTTSSPGCAIAVTRHDSTLFQHAYGMADLERDVPLTVESVFEAGSVTKQVTAAAVLLLAARGRISLDDDVRKYFPELPRYDDVITIRHLLQHTSGLRDWGAVAEIEGWPRGKRTVTHANVLDILSRQRGLNHPVGAQYSYTNSGYNLAVMLVERVTGESFPVFTKRELFDPIGMSHTGWRDDYSRIVKHRAQGYAPAGSIWKLDMPFENAYGNGGLLTTVDDFVKWNAALTARRVGNPDVSRLMETPGTLRDGKPIEYGYGLFIRDVQGVREIGHDGSTAGYRTFMARYPTSGAGVVVLCNASNGGVTGPIALGRGAVRPLVAFQPQPSTASSAFEEASINTQVDRAAMQAYLGTWHSDEAATTWTLRLSGDSLMVDRGPGMTTRLFRGGVDSFGGFGAGVRFVRGADGAVTRMLVSVPRALNVIFERR